jgi:hypothetical protein
MSCSAWLYIAEHGVNKAVDNPFDALWWGVVTLTIVGYGDVTPVTTEGRIAAMALMLLGIGLFGAITATITSYLMARDSHHDPDHSLWRPRTASSALLKRGSSSASEAEYGFLTHAASQVSAGGFRWRKVSSVGWDCPRVHLRESETDLLRDNRHELVELHD